MKRAALLFGFTLFTATLSAQSQPAKDEKTVKFYCPVAGFPETKECLCKGGYCSLKPKATLTAEYKGGKLQFCCAMCIDDFKKTPAKFAVVANHQLVATGQAVQIACPSCGGKVSEVSGDVAGIKVQFCSADCQKKVADATAKNRVEMVFADKAFVKGFEVRSKK